MLVRLSPTRFDAAAPCPFPLPRYLPPHQSLIRCAAPRQLWKFMTEPLFLNAMTCNTDEKLNELLSKLGFVSEPCNSGDLLRLPFDAKPSCYILAQSNHLESHVVVSSKDDSFQIYYYEPNNDMFGLWDTLPGNVTDTALREMILTASSIKALFERWEDEVKSTLVLGAIAKKLGQFVELHNLG